MINSEENPFTTVILVGVVSFIASMIVILLMYAVCARKYRLNWYEKNLLESVEHGNEKIKRYYFFKIFVLPSRFVCFLEKTRNHRRNLRNSGSPPPYQKRKSRAVTMARPNHLRMPSVKNLSATTIFEFEHFFLDTTPEQSSPTLVPVARNDSMIVLSTNTPVRPKIASMQSVLDPTKIDPSLYKLPVREFKNVYLKYLILNALGEQP